MSRALNAVFILCKAEVMKAVLIFITTNLICTSLFSQDIVIFKNGDELEAVVKEILPNEVKYIRYDNLDGPLYTVLKRDIFMIKYQNGTKDVMAHISDPTQTGAFGYRRITDNDYRSPGLAFLFSVLMPGGGQFYNRDYIKGGIMSGLWVTGITMVAASRQRYYYDDYSCYYDNNGNYYCGDNYYWQVRPAVAAGGSLLAANWIWSIIDAPISAAIKNRKRGTALLEFEKENKYVLKLDPFNNPGLGGSISLRF